MRSMPDSETRMQHNFISVELTGKCNNACRHCYNFWRQDGKERRDIGRGTLSKEEIGWIVDKIKEDTPLKYVALSGGEPLLRKDLPQIIEDLVNKDLQPIVITNGVLLEEALLKRLPQGIHFEVSLLGHRAAIHDKIVGKRVFNKVIENIARISRYGSYLTAAFVATKENALDVYRTTELAIALGAMGIMYNRVNLSSGMKDYAEQLVPPVEMLTDSLFLLQEAVKKYKIQSSCSVPIPPCLIETSNYPSLHFGWCPRGGDNAYYTVGYDGRLRPCNHSSIVLGDIRTEGFAEIISKQQCKALWQTLPEKCVSCTHPLKQECGGGCPAAAHEYSGLLGQIDPICELSNPAWSAHA